MAHYTIDLHAHTTASVCSPTRYSMLTGRYSWRTRLKKGVVNNNDPRGLYRSQAGGAWQRIAADVFGDNRLVTKLAFAPDGTERFAVTFDDLEDRQFWHVAKIRWPTRDIERIHRLHPGGFP